MAWGIIILSSFGIHAAEAFIRGVFSVSSNHLPIGDEGDVEEHVSVEHQSTRGALEYGGHVGSHGMHCRAECIIYDIVFSSGIHVWAGVEIGPEDVANSLVHSFADCI